MSGNLQLSVVSEEENVNTTVLRIASSAKNSITQFYSEKVFVSSQSIKDLHKKITEKLRLHYINDVSLSASIQFENDRTVNVDSIQKICDADYQTDALTQLVILKWSFIFDGTGNGDNHLHSIYVRISEGPNPGLVFQKLLSKRNEDIDSLDNEVFAPIVCKVDFMDSRFSNEILSIVIEWASALPKAEPISDAINWLRTNENKIGSFTSRTFPAVIVLAYVGIWFGYVTDQYTSSIKFASAWILGGAVIYQLSIYLVSIFNRVLSKQIRRISDVPVFMITSGDNNKITKHLSQSKNSVFKLAGAGLTYGVFKGAGLYLATYIFR